MSTIGQPLTVPHHRRALRDLAYVARLLLELPDGSLFGCFPFVDEARGHLDHDLVGWGAVLLLEDDLRSWAGTELAEH